MVHEEINTKLIRILRKGRVVGDNMLDFSMMINHRIDVSLLKRICRSVVDQENYDVDAVCTAASSGIGFSTILGSMLDKPVIFAQKGEEYPKIMSGKTILRRKITSPTKGNITSLYLRSDAFEGCNRVLLADDFLFRGTTMGALIEIIKELNLKPVEALVFVNKSFDEGWKVISQKYGVPVKKIVSINKIEVYDKKALIHIDELLFKPEDVTISLKRYVPGENEETNA
jgi:xanthine phosphoribosyltransferase